MFLVTLTFVFARCEALQPHVPSIEYIYGSLGTIDGCLKGIVGEQVNVVGVLIQWRGSSPCTTILLLLYETIEVLFHV